MKHGGATASSACTCVAELGTEIPSSTTIGQSNSMLVVKGLVSRLTSTQCFKLDKSLRCGDIDTVGSLVSDATLPGTVSWNLPPWPSSRACDNASLAALATSEKLAPRAPRATSSCVPRQQASGPRTTLLHRTSLSAVETFSAVHLACCTSWTIRVVEASDNEDVLRMATATSKVSPR